MKSQESRKTVHDERDPLDIQGDGFALFEDLIYSLDGMIWEIEFDRNQKPRITFVSPNVELLLGYAPERFFRDPDFWLEPVHPDDRNWVWL